MNRAVSAPCLPSFTETTYLDQKPQWLNRTRTSENTSITPPLPLKYVSTGWYDYMYLYRYVYSADVRKSRTEVEAMKRQAKGLAQEYDRLLTEHTQLQVTHTNNAHTHTHTILTKYVGLLHSFVEYSILIGQLLPLLRTLFPTVESNVGYHLFFCRSKTIFQSIKLFLFCVLLYFVSNNWSL